MERKIKKMIMDLRFLKNHGQINVDLTDFRYQEMLCSAIEASGRKYNFDVYENILLLKLV